MGKNRQKEPGWKDWLEGITGFGGIGMLPGGRMADRNTRAAEFSPEEIDRLVQHPGENARALRSVSAGLAAGIKTYDLILQTYQDLLTFDWYITLRDGGREPDPEQVRRDVSFACRLVEAMDLPLLGHEITGLCLQYGKVFFTPRVCADPRTGQVDYAFLQQLPEDWCRIVGRNNGPGKYTVAFNMTYFQTAGTDPAEFGDLFLPYWDGFCSAQEDRERERNRQGFWVTLPPEKVIVFEVCDRTSEPVPPETGLMAGMSRLPDYEAVQMEQLLNPLTAVMTGSLETGDSQRITAADPVRISPTTRQVYETLWDRMMHRNGAGGVGLFLAPAKDLKLQSLNDVKGASGITSAAVGDQILKAGLAALVPATTDPKECMTRAAARMAVRVPEPVYGRFMQMFDGIFRQLGLSPELHLVVFGDIFSRQEEMTRAREGMLAGDPVDTLIYRALQGVHGREAELLRRCKAG